MFPLQEREWESRTPRVEWGLYRAKKPKTQVKPGGRVLAFQLRKPSNFAEFDHAGDRLDGAPDLGGDAVAVLEP
jgi:hypothetical protein